MKKTKIAFVLAIIIFTQCTKKVEISQWRGENRNGIYQEENLLEKWPEDGPELIWENKDLGCGYSSAAVISDKVITAGTLDSITYLFAFSHEGEILWKSKLGKEWMTNFPGINSTPLLYGDLGYIIDGLGKLYCFNVEDGTVQWTKDVFNDFDGVNNKYGITENFLIDGEKLFCTPGGKKNNVIALNRFNGELIWTCPGEGQASAYCSPSIINHNEKRYLITATDSAILSINPDNGKLAWSYNLGKNWGTKANMPVYKNNHLFIPTNSAVGSSMLKIAEDGNSVKEVWNTSYLNRNRGEVVVLDDVIYGTHNRKKKIFKLDWNTGNVLDSLQLEQASTLISDGKMIYSYDHAGNIQLITDSNEGLESVSSFEFKLDSITERRIFHCSYQVIHDGRLYVRCDNILRVYSITKS